MSSGDINSVHIAGRLTRDPEISATKGGTSILSFSLASNARRKNSQTGQWEDKPNYVDCKVFGNRADSLARFLHKGMPVVVEGELDHQSWVSQDGSKRSKLQIVAEKVQFTPAQAYHPQAPAYQQPAQAYQPQAPYPSLQDAQTMSGVATEPAVLYATPGAYDEEIPF